MRVAALIESMAARETPCLVWRGATVSGTELEARRRAWLRVLDEKSLGPGAVVGLKGDYTPDSISLLFALLGRGCVASLVPASAVVETPYMEDGRIEVLFQFDAAGAWTWEPAPEAPETPAHPLIAALRARGEAGFTIFSSGSTGHPKAVLHSAERFLAKFDRPGKPFRTLAFLLFDHIAGLDTLFYTLSAGGTLVLPARRDPLSVCRLVHEHRIQVLPASPAFLSLLCLSGDHRDFDLSSLEIITYGSEPMSQQTLDLLCGIFPAARLVQKYGTSEFGAPRARSRGNDSLWLKLKTDELDAKVVDGMLWIRSETAMMGYLNAPSPFDEAGWYCTGDMVEREGEWLPILGRKSDIIVVGGEKVYPQEVEAAVLEMETVEDVLVKGEPHPIMGHIVTAEVRLRGGPRDAAAVRKEVRKHCRERLAPYKIPAKVRIAEGPLTTGRHKKVRQ
ncbi:MAG: long-chain fatty acid--CoA ligase [Kiloniellaceae bacterium]